VAGSPYPITASGAADIDYGISYVAGTLTIMSAPVTMPANNQTKVYGAPLPTLTVTYTGLVNRDTPATFATAPNTAPTVSTTATTGSSVAGSPCPITVSGAVNAEYSITYQAGKLTVTEAPLTVTAKNALTVSGKANPTFTVSYSGFVNGDTPNSLSGTLSFTTPATTSSPAGRLQTTTPSRSSTARWLSRIRAASPMAAAGLTRRRELTSPTPA
jgi:hypothetical protein